MVITDLKQLEKLMILCKKRGVLAIKIDNIEFTISPEAPKYNSLPAPASGQGVGSTINTFDPGQIPEVMPELIKDPQGLTEEQMLFGSSDPSVWQSN